MEEIFGDLSKMDPAILHRMVREGQGKSPIDAFQTHLVVAADEAVARCIRDDTLIEYGFTAIAKEIAKLLMGKGSLTID